jgi:tropomyosin-1
LFYGHKYAVAMTTNIQQGTLDVLKEKMRRTKEDEEKYKDEYEEFHKRLQVEVESEVAVLNLPIQTGHCYSKIG